MSAPLHDIVSILCAGIEVTPVRNATNTVTQMGYGYGRPTYKGTYKELSGRATCALTTVAALLLVSPVQAQNTPISSSGSSPHSGMKITSCVLSSTIDVDKTYDCSSVVAKLCDGKRECEIPIGYNLSAGKDIEPSGGFLGKKVAITFTCGSRSVQRGPYHQNDHATLLLDCSGGEL